MGLEAEAVLELLLLRRGLDKGATPPPLAPAPATKEDDEEDDEGEGRESTPFPCSSPDCPPLPREALPSPLPPLLPPLL